MIKTIEVVRHIFSYLNMKNVDFVWRFLQDRNSYSRDHILYFKKYYLYNKAKLRNYHKKSYFLEAFYEHRSCPTFLHLHGLASGSPSGESTSPRLEFEPSISHSRDECLKTCLWRHNEFLFSFFPDISFYTELVCWSRST